MFNKTNLTSTQVIRRVVKWALIIDVSLAALVATFITYFAMAFATSGSNAPALWEIAGIWFLGFGLVFFKAGIVIGVISVIFLLIALSGRSTKS